MQKPAGFSKHQRLLKAAEFSAVFDNAVIKVSNRYFLILCKSNGLECGRLGLVVAKKHCKLAVSRNLVKRLVRESFRHHQQHLTGIDAIVLARKGLEQVSNQDVQQQLKQLWLKVEKKAQAFSE